MRARTPLDDPPRISVNGRGAPPAGSPRACRKSERLLERLVAVLPDDLREFRRRGQEVEDWDAILQCAREHGLASEIRHHLIATGCALPPSAKQALELQRAQAQLAAAWLRTRLDEALEALEGAGVQSVALKGPVLGARLYADPSARLSSDLDLLVAPADLDRAVAALARIGYVAETGPSARYYRRHSHHIRLDRERSPRIELHFRAHTGFGTVLPAEPLLERAAPYTTASGRALGILAPEDEFLYLAVHASSHGFAALSLLYELKLFLGRAPELDWATVVQRARQASVATALGFACHLLRGRLNGAIPARADLAPPRGARARAATSLLAVIAAFPPFSPAGILSRLAFQALLCDHAQAAVGLLSHELGRSARRRMRRRLPGLTPEEWGA